MPIVNVFVYFCDRIEDLPKTSMGSRVAGNNFNLSTMIEYLLTRSLGILELVRVSACFNIKNHPGRDLWISTVVHTPRSMLYGEMLVPCFSATFRTVLSFSVMVRSVMCSPDSNDNNMQPLEEYNIELQGASRVWPEGGCTCPNLTP